MAAPETQVTDQVVARQLQKRDCVLRHGYSFYGKEKKKKNRHGTLFLPSSRAQFSRAWTETTCVRNLVP